MNTKRAMAHIQISADSTRMGRELAQAKQRMDKFKAGVTKSLGSLSKGVGLGVVGGMGLGIAGGLGNAAAEAARDYMDLDEALTAFRVDAQLNTEQLAAFRKELTRVGGALGKSETEVLAGGSAYVELTSDIEGAAKATEVIARVGVATRAAAEDIAKSTAAFRVAGLGVHQYEDAWSGLVNQAQQGGAVSVKEMGAEMSTLLPMMSQFGGTAEEKLRQAGAALQVIRTGSESGAAASTKLQSVIGSIGKNAANLRKVGVEIWELDPATKKPTDRMRQWPDIIKDIAKLGLNIETMGSVLGNDKETAQGIRMLTTQLGLLDKLTEAGKVRGVIERDMNTMLDSQSAKVKKLDTHWRRMKRELVGTAADAVLPVLEGVHNVGATGKQYMDRRVRLEQLKREKLALITSETRAGRAKFEDGRATFSDPRAAQRALEIAKEKEEALQGRKIDFDFTSWGNANPFQMSTGGTAEGAFAGLMSAAHKLSEAADKLTRTNSGGLAGILQRAVEEGMARASVSVKANGNAIAKTAANASLHRNGKKSL